MPQHVLFKIYDLLFAKYGPQHWWPGDSPFEVIIGAILTQSAAWANVEKAIDNLKTADALTPAALRDMASGKLAQLLYSCGYYNAKAKKLRAFIDHLKINHNDSVNHLFNQPVDELRKELLSIHGVGNETADSIILYAAEKPVFVIDAYTRRIFERLGYEEADSKYESFQAWFMEAFSPDTRLFNEYHALLVRHGKEVCKKTPLCKDCCIGALCRYRGSSHT